MKEKLVLFKLNGQHSKTITAAGPSLISWTSHNVETDEDEEKGGRGWRVGAREERPPEVGLMRISCTGRR